MAAGKRRGGETMLPPVTRMRVLSPNDNGCLDTQTQGDSKVPTKRRINYQQGQQNCNTAKGKKKP